MRMRIIIYQLIRIVQTDILNYIFHIIPVHAHITAVKLSSQHISSVYITSSMCVRIFLSILYIHV